ncbi:hypothetical protein [Winogradskyella psychrotolerans]|uniref:hypothetical protein n=1 Tax=Winogradskyella psychrotolerans TaxID=1344585 RepID=UPI001C075301|nr:hypothetical protein [Winogradskyella psychrotolerans]MBU2929752.1 hypothetical protein [Winogradskyella psychrotolerans]
MKKLLTITFLSLILTSCGNLEEGKLISEFNAKESYRIWTTEKRINKNDSIYFNRKSFKAFDSKNRLINDNNWTFYYYNENRIDKIKSIYKREGKGTAKIDTQNYIYDKNGLLKYIVENRKKNDTIKSFKYDSEKNLIETKTNFRTITQEFENGVVKKRIESERNAEPKISEFYYDSLNRPITENWSFSGNQRMKTRFEYNEKGRLFKEIDSSFNQGTNPNEFVEFMTEYKFDKNDSIVEIIKLGRVLSESDFKERGKTLIERKKE